MDPKSHFYVKPTTYDEAVALRGTGRFTTVTTNLPFSITVRTNHTALFVSHKSRGLKSLLYKVSISQLITTVKTSHST